MADLARSIGNTPLVELRRIVPPGSARVFVKVESANPTGSHKDRMALAMIEAAEARGALRPGMTVLECTGGNTGCSLAWVCAVKGYRFTVVSSDAYSKEKLDTLRAFGAELLIEPAVGGKVTPDLWPRMLARAEVLRREPHVFYTDQFHNRDAHAGQARLGAELADELARVDVFCAMVGTAGLLMGAGRALRERFPAVRIVALEPTSSAVLSGGAPGPHRVDGTASGFVPPLFDRDVAREVRALDETLGRVTARRLARDEGLFAGTSTGMNVAAALELARELGPDRVVVTVACDSGLKYLSSDLFA